MGGLDMDLAILFMSVSMPILEHLARTKAAGLAQSLLLWLRGFLSLFQAGSCLPQTLAAFLVALESRSDWHRNFCASGCLHYGGGGHEAVTMSS